MNTENTTKYKIDPLDPRVIDGVKQLRIDELNLREDYRKRLSMIESEFEDELIDLRRQSFQDISNETSVPTFIVEPIYEQLCNEDHPDSHQLDPVLFRI